MRRGAFAAVAFALAGGAMLAGVAPEPPRADFVFARAKAAWRARQEAPFVSFGLRERYHWRGRLHDNWWHAAYRDRDRELALRRIIVPAEEEQRLKGSAIALNLRFHHGFAHADSFDTNAGADAFPILDPLVAPNASFGLVRQEPHAQLVGSATPLPGKSAPPSESPAPRAPSPSPAPGAAAFVVHEKPLRELAHVEAVARDYAIALAGTENVRGADAFHLTLVPLRDPRVYRLRDLWVDTSTYATLQLTVQGLFEGKPYDDARWTVSYVPLDGRYYVQQVRADDALRFGLDRVVTNLQFDFVQYEFPPTLPEMTFARWLR